MTFSSNVEFELTESACDPEPKLISADEFADTVDSALETTVPILVLLLTALDVSDPTDRVVVIFPFVLVGEATTCENTS